MLDVVFRNSSDTHNNGFVRTNAKSDCSAHQDVNLVCRCQLAEVPCDT